MKTQKSSFEQNGVTYTQVGDVLLPDISIGEAGQRPIGKYGRMWKRYLKEHRPVQRPISCWPENSSYTSLKSMKTVKYAQSCSPVR